METLCPAGLSLVAIYDAAFMHFVTDGLSESKSTAKIKVGGLTTVWNKVAWINQNQEVM